MARKVQVLLIDDLSGRKADETVSFELDGQRYEIDLSTANARKLRALFAPYSAKARRAGSAAKTTGSARSARVSRPGRTDRATAQTIRAWYAQHGKRKLSDRGRLPQDVVDEYYESNS